MNLKHQGLTAGKKIDHAGDRTQNLLIRSQTPCHWATRPRLVIDSFSENGVYGPLFVFLPLLPNPRGRKRGPAFDSVDQKPKPYALTFDQSATLIAQTVEES